MISNVYKICLDVKESQRVTKEGMTYHVPVRDLVALVLIALQSYSLKIAA